MPGSLLRSRNPRAERDIYTMRRRRKNIFCDLKKIFTGKFDNKFRRISQNSGSIWKKILPNLVPQSSAHFHSPPFKVFGMHCAAGEIFLGEGITQEKSSRLFIKCRRSNFWELSSNLLDFSNISSNLWIFRYFFWKNGPGQDRMLIKRRAILGSQDHMLRKRGATFPWGPLSPGEVWF